MSEKDFSEDERDAPEASGADAAATAEDESRGLAYTQARLAYSIINALLEHTRVTSDLVALMAQVLGEETARALTQTPHWSAYLDSRRTLERTRQEIEQFAEVWTQLAGDEPPPRP